MTQSQYRHARRNWEQEEKNQRSVRSKEKNAEEELGNTGKAMGRGVRRCEDTPCGATTRHVEKFTSHAPCSFAQSKLDQQRPVPRMISVGECVAASDSLVASRAAESLGEKWDAGGGVI